MAGRCFLFDEDRQMGITFLLLLIIICGILLMLWAGVAFIQDKKYFTSAPKDVQEAIQSREERFRGAHAVGWILMAVAAILVIGSVIFAIVDGIRKDFSFGQFFSPCFAFFLYTKNRITDFPPTYKMKNEKTNERASDYLTKMVGKR